MSYPKDFPEAHTDPTLELARIREAIEHLGYKLEFDRYALEDSTLLFTDGRFTVVVVFMDSKEVGDQISFSPLHKRAQETGPL